MNDNLLASALRIVLRELENIPEGEDVPIANIAPYLKVAALRAVTDIADMAKLLLRSIDPGPPLGVSDRVVIGNALVSTSRRLEGAFSLFMWVLNKDLSAVRLRVLLEAANAIHEHADTLKHVTPDADSETQLSSDEVVTLARGLLVLVKLLHQELIATPPAPRTPPPQPDTAHDLQEAP